MSKSYSTGDTRSGVSYPWKPEGGDLRRFVVALTSALVLASGSSVASGQVPRVPLSASAIIHGPLADRDSDGRVDSSFLREPLSGGLVRISLVLFDGTRIWSFDLLNQSSGKPGADELPAPAAAGDYSGDAVTDFVFAARGRLEPQSLCGTYLETWTQLIFVDGRTGKTTTALPRIPNRCWTFASAGVTYPTDRWPGYVQIGEIARSYRGNEVIVIPNYPPEDRGWVLNLQHQGAWSKVLGRDNADSLIFPSHPDFGTYYNSVNPSAPCHPTLGYPYCHVPDSHLPTGLLIGTDVARGALLMTTGRALIYRSDLTPTSDTTWTSGSTPNGGRNYGLALSFSHQAKQYAVLIGGCPVRSAREAMKTGVLPGGRQDTSLGSTDGHCGIHHHYESFLLQGLGIAGHFNHYYSYSVSDGFFHARPEFPGTPVGPIGGVGTMWIGFNLFDAPPGSQGEGQWQIELRPNPSDPSVVVKQRGWYIWDIVDLNSDGKAEILATRAAANSTSPYVLPWEVDVLVWNGQDLESVFHRNGVAPSLFKYSSDSTKYFSGGMREGTLTGDDKHGDVKVVMVEDKTGARSLLRVPARALQAR